MGSGCGIWRERRDGRWSGAEAGSGAGSFDFGDWGGLIGDAAWSGFTAEFAADEVDIGPGGGEFGDVVFGGGDDVFVEGVFDVVSLLEEF